MKSEASPLINEPTPKRSKIKPTLARLFAIFLLCTLAAILYYCSINGPAALTSSRMYLTDEEEIEQEQENVDVPARPDPFEQELISYREKTVLIEYSINDLPPNANLNNLDSATMDAFHDELIKLHGYNTDDHVIHFAVMDEDDDDNYLENDAKSSGMACSTMYTTSRLMSDTTRLMELNCRKEISKAYAVTGCLSYEPDNNGERWGETGYYTSNCYTNRVSLTDGAFTSLTGRCCRSKRKDKQLRSTYISYYDADSATHCLETMCADADYTAIGCSASVSHGYTRTFSGTKRTTEASSGYSGCKAQRGDIGYIWEANYCGYLRDSTTQIKTTGLKCRSVKGTTANQDPSTGKYQSLAQCPLGYSMTDCNAYVDDEIDACKKKKLNLVGNQGVTYGGYITTHVPPICVAVGDTNNVVAQAVCCRIGA